jgi:general stress protein CsbA
MTANALRQARASQRAFQANAASALAAGAAIFIHAAGRIGATGVGDQLTGLKVMKTSSHTATKANTIVDKGTYVLRVSNTDGLFPGLAVTGTGIGASAKITYVNPDNTVTVDVVSTTSGTVTTTYTYTDSTIHWLTCYLNNAFSIT